MNIKHNDVNDPALKRMLSNLSDYIKEYRNTFFRSTKDFGELSELYISGLIKTERGKRNMERLDEDLIWKEMVIAVQQFITDSTWDSFGLMVKLPEYF